MACRCLDLHINLYTQNKTGFFKLQMPDRIGLMLNLIASYSITVIPVIFVTTVRLGLDLLI